MPGRINRPPPRRGRSFGPFWVVMVVLAIASAVTSLSKKPSSSFRVPIASYQPTPWIPPPIPKIELPQIPLEAVLLCEGLSKTDCIKEAPRCQWKKGCREATKMKDISKPPQNPTETFRAIPSARSPVGTKSVEAVPVKTGLLRGKGRAGIAPLRIVTPAGANYIIKLVDAATNTEHLLIYIDGGSSFETKVPLGTYKIRGASGSTWYGTTELFGPSTSFFELRTNGAENTFSFTRSGNQIRGREIRLIKQVDGNLETSAIGREQF
jgi:hypothetical protein